MPRLKNLPVVGDLGNRQQAYVYMPITPGRGDQGSCRSAASKQWLMYIINRMPLSRQPCICRSVL